MNNKETIIMLRHILMNIAEDNLLISDYFSDVFTDLVYKYSGKYEVTDENPLSKYKISKLKKLYRDKGIKLKLKLSYDNHLIINDHFRSNCKVYSINNVVEQVLIKSLDTLVSMKETIKNPSSSQLISNLLNRFNDSMKYITSNFSEKLNYNISPMGSLIFIFKDYNYDKITDLIKIVLHEFGRNFIGNNINLKLPYYSKDKLNYEVNFKNILMYY